MRDFYVRNIESEMAGGGNSPVVAIKLSGSTQAETWSEAKLLGGDVVLQVNDQYSTQLLNEHIYTRPETIFLS